MKKTLFTAAAAFALLSLGACSNQNCSKGSCGDAGDKEEVYTGVLPAADADGIRYTLDLDFDDDNNYTDGDYDLVQTYLVSDTTATSGISDANSFKSKGDFTVAESNGKKYLKLVPDRKFTNAEPLNFLVESDSTIVLVGADLQPSATPGLNYTLKLVK